MKRILISLFIATLFLGGVVWADGTDAYDNTVYGTRAGQGLETDATGLRAYGNVFIGSSAGESDSTGSANVGIGYGALRRMTSGYGNISIGYMSGDANTTSNHNLYINNGFNFFFCGFNYNFFYQFGCPNVYKLIP